MRLRRLATALLATSLTLGACSSDDATVTPEVDATVDGQQDANDAGAPASDEPGAQDTDAATAPDDTESSATPDDTATTQSSAPPPATTAPPASQEPGTAPTPIPAGRYSYATDGETQVGVAPPRPMPSTTTLEARPAGSDDHQLQVRDLRDDEGRGSVTTTELQYGVEGVVLHGLTNATTVEVFGSNTTQETAMVAKPPSLIAPVGMDVGSRATFHLEGDDVVADGTVEATGREVLVIGGDEVEVLVVKLVVTFSGATEGEQRSTWWLRPRDLLTVREESVLTATSQGVDIRSEHTSELRSLSPA